MSVAPSRPVTEAALRKTAALLSRLAPPLVVAVVVLGAWQLFVSVGVVDVKTVSEPTMVARLVWQTLGGTRLFGFTIWTDIWTTVRAVLYGYVIGSVVGIVVGFLLGRVRFLGEVFQPYLQAIAAVPKIALVPLLVLIFGLGTKAETANVIIMVFVMVVFSTFSGASEIREDYVTAARTMGANRWTVTLRVVLPAAVPSVLVGLRAAVPFAFVGAITSEFIASSKGLGWMMQQATAQFDPTGLFAGLCYIVTIVWVMGQVVKLAESWLMRWRRP
jgi:NitT/TauT family transport system permease protein